MIMKYNILAAIAMGGVIAQTLDFRATQNGVHLFNMAAWGAVFVFCAYQCIHRFRSQGVRSWRR